MANHGYGTTATQPPSTKNRRTRVRFDVPITITKEPLFALSRTMDQLAAVDDPAARQNVHLVPGVGWELTPYQMDGSRKQEQSVVSGSFLRVGLSPGQMQIADTFEEGPGWQPESYTGVTYDAAVSTGATDYFISRAVTAGASFGGLGAAMLADMVSVPGPTEETQNTSVDRVAVSNSVYTQNQPLFFEWYSSGSDFDTPDILHEFYFPGPVRTDLLLSTYSGEYCLATTGDGYAILFARYIDSIPGHTKGWLQVAKWRYCPQHQAMAQMHRVYIRCSDYDARLDREPRIVFVFTSGDVSSGVLAQANGVDVSERVTNRYKYIVPRGKPQMPNGKRIPLGKSQLRVSVRRDQWPYLQVSLAKRPPTGILTDGVFKMGHYPSDTTVPLRALWFGHVPSGCSITVELFSALTNTALAFAGAAFTFPGGGGRDFTIPAWDPTPTNEFYAKFTLTGDGDQRSPIFVEARYQRDGITTTSDPAIVPEFSTDDNVAAMHLPNKALIQVSTTGAESDPTQFSANIQLEDFVNDLYKLKSRGEIPAIVETRYDADPSHWARLAMGYILEPEALKRGFKGTNRFGGDPNVNPQNYPSSNWHSYDLTMVGMHHRLRRQRTTHSINMSTADDTGQGTPLATSLLKLLFHEMGVPDSELDIPTIPGIRIFPGSFADAPQQIIKANTDLLAFAQRVARDYLSSFMFHDENAGTKGMWRLKVPPVEPYQNLLDFVTTGPSGASRLSHMDVAYDSTLEGSQTVQKTFIYKGTMRPKRIPPQCNAIVVTAGADLGAGFNSKVTATLCNFKSAKFFDDQPIDPDPTDPDYLGEPVVRFIIVPSVSDPPGTAKGTAVNWMCRAYYDLLCHGYDELKFFAPLPLITDVSDTKQTSPRPPRHYDPVRVNGIQYLIRNCNIMNRKDAHQRAYYELMTPRAK